MVNRYKKENESLRNEFSTIKEHKQLLSKASIKISQLEDKMQSYEKLFSETEQYKKQMALKNEACQQEKESEMLKLKEERNFYQKINDQQSNIIRHRDNEIKEYSNKLKMYNERSSSPQTIVKDVEYLEDLCKDVWLECKRVNDEIAEDCTNRKPNASLSAKVLILDSYIRKLKPNVKKVLNQNTSWNSPN